MKSYTHQKIEFEWGGGLNVYKIGQFMPLKMQLNNFSPSWRLNRNVWLSVKQLKKIIVGNNNK